MLKASSIGASPQQDQSPDISSITGADNAEETVNILKEKLSVALLNITAKEEIVKQHAKVAEEAVAGWEHAQAEVTALKQQLEVALQKNSSLQDQVCHLDDALKECVRQLRQSREEQDKINDTVIKKAREWDLDRSELEGHIRQLQRQLDTARSEAAASIHLDLQGKLHAMEKENRELKVELLAQSRDLQILTVERNLSNEAAEAASKQHLESIKKITKIDAECRRLHHLMRRASLLSMNESCHVSNSIFVEFLNDSQSGSSEQMQLAVATENAGCNSGMWASALMAELDQFKNGKDGSRCVDTTDVMDDFLEMERLAALPEADTNKDYCSSRINAVSIQSQLKDLQANVGLLECEKGELKAALAEMSAQLEISLAERTASERKLFDLQKQLDLGSESIQSHLKDLQAKVGLLEREKGELEAAVVETSTQLEMSLAGQTTSEQKLFDLQKQLDLGSESIQSQLKDLQAKVGLLECEKGELEAALAETSTQLEMSLAEQTAYEQRLFDLQKQLDLASVSKLEALQEIQHLEGQIKDFDCQLSSALSGMQDLNAALCSSEAMLNAERESSAEYERKLAAAVAAKASMEALLQSANLQVVKLQENVTSMQDEIIIERASSAELRAKLTAAEASRTFLETEFESAQVAAKKLEEKVVSLESELEEAVLSIAELATRMEAVDSRKKEMECRFEASSLEATNLSNTVSVLQRKLEEEKLLTDEHAAKCRHLEAQMSRDTRDARLWRLANSNGELKIKQEREIARAAGKLRECQKTIASLGQQLKALSEIDDDDVPESMNLEYNSLLLDFGDVESELCSPIVPGLCGFTGLKSSNHSGGTKSAFSSATSSSSANFTTFSSFSSLNGYSIHTE